MILLEALKFKQVGFLTPLVQIVIICGLFALALITQRKEYKKTGKIYGRYPWRISTFLSSTYEEIIFRGFILSGLMAFLPTIWSVVISSILFGLWHFKNYIYQSRKETIHQVLYTGFIFGTIASVITLWTGTIWLAVIVHYIHNLFADEYRKMNQNIRVKFTALFVKDIEGLLKRFPPKHKKVFGHHSTIEFQPESLAGLEIGKEYSIKIIGRAYDEFGDDLLIENQKSKNKYPHITLSRGENAPSLYSKILFEKGKVEYFENEEVTVIEGYSDGENYITQKA